MQNFGGLLLGKGARLPGVSPAMLHQLAVIFQVFVLPCMKLYCLRLHFNWSSLGLLELGCL